LYGDCGGSVSATGGVARREDCHGGGSPLLLESGRRCTPCGGAGRRPRLRPVRRSWAASPASGRRPLRLGSEMAWWEAGGRAPWAATGWTAPVRRRPHLRLRPTEFVGALPWTARVVIGALPWTALLARRRPR
jgi:hypothetical protein